MPLGDIIASSKLLKNWFMDRRKFYNPKNIMMIAHNIIYHLKIR